MRLKSTRWICSGLARGDERGRELGAHDDAAGVGVRAHRVNRLVHELVESHVLHRPADVAGLQA
jgi:hypothetical protein